MGSRVGRSDTEGKRGGASRMTSGARLEQEAVTSRASSVRSCTEEEQKMILRGQQELGRKLRGMMMMPGEPERVEMKARARMTATGDRLEQRAATSKGQRVRAGTQRNL